MVTLRVKIIALADPLIFQVSIISVVIIESYLVEYPITLFCEERQIRLFKEGKQLKLVDLSFVRSISFIPQILKRLSRVVNILLFDIVSTFLLLNLSLNLPDIVRIIKRLDRLLILMWSL